MCVCVCVYKKITATVKGLLEKVHNAMRTELTCNPEKYQIMNTRSTVTLSSMLYVKSDNGRMRKVANKP